MVAPEWARRLEGASSQATEYRSPELLEVREAIREFRKWESIVWPVPDGDRT